MKQEQHRRQNFSRLKLPNLRLATLMTLIALNGCKPAEEAVPRAIDTNAPLFLGQHVSQLRIVEKVTMLGLDMGVSANGIELGRVEQRMLNITPTFELIDGSGNKVARAEQKLLSWGVQIDIFDQSNNLLGTLKEEVIENLFSISTKYSIVDPKGKILGTSDKLSLFGTDITIKTPDGQMVMKLDRDLINVFRVGWTATVHSEKIDLRLVAFVASYKTYADKKREEEKAEKKKKEDQEKQKDKREEKRR